MFICSAIGIIANNYQKKLISQSTAMSTNKDNTEIKDNNAGTANQKQNSNSPSNKTTSKSNVSKTSTAAKGATTSKNTSSNTTATTAVTKPPTANKPTAAPNFFIIDTVNNKTIYSSRENYGQSNVESITTHILSTEKIAYKDAGGYFQMIAGLSDTTYRSQYPNSGWCYYINGKKLDVGAAAYIPKSEDIIEWKFLANGLAN
jgi:hypothetical protein